jgi:hypothetical protein
MSSDPNVSDFVVWTEELLPELLEETRRSLSALRDSIFRALPDETKGSSLSRALRRYMDALLQNVRRLMNNHSAYFWLYHHRRLHIHVQELNAASHKWEKSGLAAFEHQYFAASWYMHRLTLALLKYGNQQIQNDMQRKSASHRGASGRLTPRSLIKDDVSDLLSAAILMAEFEHARDCLRRTGMGGKLRKHEASLEVFLDARIEPLVMLYDRRVNRGSNPLSAYGSWAYTPFAYDFPLPGGSFIPLHPWPFASDYGSLVRGSHKPIVMSLGPNLAGQGRGLPWALALDPERKLPPPWLFSWLDLSNVIERLALVRGGLFESRLRRSGRHPYDPEDIVFALAAMTAHELEEYPRRDTFLTQIAAYGYDVWSDVHAKVEAEILPRFADFRQKHSLPSTHDRDLLRLFSVLRDLSWEASDPRDTKIAACFPMKIIFPIGHDEWLLDWTVMSQLLFEQFERLGKWFGTFAIEKGHDLERALVEVFTSVVPALGASVWWYGEGKRRLSFGAGRSRDLDIGIILNDWLVLIEVKALGGSRELLFLGDPEELDKRTEKLQTALFQVDSLSRRLAACPRGRNFLIPSTVRKIVGVVCSPFPEWTSSTNSFWWIYPDFPRVCQPDDVVELLRRIKRGEYPVANGIGVAKK